MVSKSLTAAFLSVLTSPGSSTSMETKSEGDRTSEGRTPKQALYFEVKQRLSSKATQTLSVIQLYGEYLGVFQGDASQKVSVRGITS